MLRNLALAFFGLSFLAGPAAARGDGPADGRRADSKVSRSAKAAAGPQAQPSSPLLRRVVATAAVRPVAAPAVAAACGRPFRGQGARCRGGGVQLAAGAGGGWARGLPPALGVQARECPAGTMATLAEGHDDVVRCIPV